VEKFVNAWLFNNAPTLAITSYPCPPTSICVYLRLNEKREKFAEGSIKHGTVD
jgi:hypothetical protein